METASKRLADAISTDPSFQNILNLARTLAHEGLTQEQLTRVFETARADRERDDDGVAYNTILDVLDFIQGWCAPDKALFPGA